MHPYPWEAIQNVNLRTDLDLWEARVHCFNKSKGYRRKLACLGYFVERLVTSLKIYSAHYSVLISKCIVVDDNTWMILCFWKHSFQTSPYLYLLWGWSILGYTVVWIHATDLLPGLGVPSQSQSYIIHISPFPAGLKYMVFSDRSSLSFYHFLALYSTKAWSVLQTSLWVRLIGF